MVCVSPCRKQNVREQDTGKDNLATVFTLLGFLEFQSVFVASPAAHRAVVELLLLASSTPLQIEGLVINIVGRVSLLVSASRRDCCLVETKVEQF